MSYAHTTDALEVLPPKGIATDSQASSRRTAAIALLVSLSMTGLTAFSVGHVRVTLFLVVCAFAVPKLLIGARGRTRLFNAPVLAGVILFSAVVNAGATDSISVVYSMIFIGTHVALMNARQVIGRSTFAYVLKVIIVAYFCNVVIAQILVLAGAPDDFLGTVFTRYDDLTRDDVGLRYHGFSSEPSYAAFVVLSALLALYSLPGGLARRDELGYSALVLYQIFAFDSVFGYFLGLAVAGWIAFRVMSRTRFLMLAAAALWVVLLFDYSGQGRAGRILDAVLTENLDSAQSLGFIDSSLFMRVAPVIEYWGSAGLSELHTYVGHGPMAHEAEYTDVFAPWLDDGVQLQTGFVPGFCYDFGLIGAILVLIVISRLISERRISVQMLILVTMMFNANFNTQLFWFVVVVFAMTKAYRAEAAVNEHSSQTA